MTLFEKSDVLVRYPQLVLPFYAERVELVSFMSRALRVPQHLIDPAEGYGISFRYADVNFSIVEHWSDGRWALHAARRDWESTGRRAPKGDRRRRKRLDPQLPKVSSAMLVATDALFEGSGGFVEPYVLSGVEYVVIAPRTSTFVKDRGLSERICDTFKIPGDHATFVSAPTAPVIVPQDAVGPDCFEDAVSDFYDGSHETIAGDEAACETYNLTLFALSNAEDFVMVSTSEFDTRRRKFLKWLRAACKRKEKKPRPLVAS